MDPSVGNFNVSMEERGLFACVGGGLAGYGVGVGVSLLLDELESSRYRYLLPHFLLPWDY